MSIADMSDPATMTGAPVHGSDGAKLGKVDSIYFDNATNKPEWAAVKSGLFGGHVSLVPLQRGSWDGNALTVPFDKEAIKAAPHHDPDPELRKPIWQPGGALYYWHRATQPSTPGGRPNFAAMQPWERQIYDIWETAATAAQPSQRKTLYDRWQVLFAQNLPVIMIAKPMAVGAIQKRYGNYIYSLGVIPGFNPVPLIYQQ